MTAQVIGTPDDRPRFDYVYGENVEHAYEGVRITIERITPSIARLMLNSNVSNRNMRQTNLKDAMDIDEWVLNGSSIVFSDEGVLLDGQHRLAACISSGKTIDTVVIRGISKQSQISMDSGVKRRPCDYLSMMGYKKSDLMAAAATALLKRDVAGLGDSFKFRNGNSFTIKTIVDFAVRNYETRI